MHNVHNHSANGTFVFRGDRLKSSFPGADFRPRSKQRAFRILPRGHEVRNVSGIRRFRARLRGERIGKSASACPEGATTFRHLQTSPVLTVGHPSSGRSTSAALIREYVGVAFGTQVRIIPEYFRRLAGYGDVGMAENRHRLVSDVPTGRWFRRGRKFANCHTDEAPVVAPVRTVLARSITRTAPASARKALRASRPKMRHPRQ